MHTKIAVSLFGTKIKTIARKLTSAVTILALAFGSLPVISPVQTASAASTIYVSSTTPGTLIPGVGYVIKVNGGTLSIL